MNKNKIQSIFNNYIVKPALGLGLIYSFSSCRPQTAEEKLNQRKIAYSTPKEQEPGPLPGVYNGFKEHYIGEIKDKRGNYCEIQDMRIADMDSDGDLDIIVIGKYGEIKILENQLSQKTETE